MGMTRVVKDPPVFFLCVEIYHGFPLLCCKYVGMGLDEMWEMIPFLGGHEFFVSVCIVPLDI